MGGAGGLQLRFYPKFEEREKDQKLRRNIKIHGELSNKWKSLHFDDFAPNWNYRDSLKTFGVVSRMPTGVYFPKKAPTPPGSFKKRWKGSKRFQQLQKHFLSLPPFGFPPLHQSRPNAKLKLQFETLVGATLARFSSFEFSELAFKTFNFVTDLLSSLFYVWLHHFQLQLPNISQIKLWTLNCHQESCCSLALFFQFR